MRYLEDPGQTRLFDVFADILSPTASQKLRKGWQHLFRSAILNRLPAKKLADHFHPEMDRPTKELYSMAGLLFIMEFRDWTHEDQAAIPGTACQSDGASLVDVIGELKQQGFSPSQLLADTAYGSDENHCHCRKEGIQRISPTAGKCPENQIDLQRLTAAGFPIAMGTNIQASGRVETCPQCVTCPAGIVPHCSHYDHDTNQIKVLQLPETCRACPINARRPQKRESCFRVVTINPQQVRLIERRRHEKTDDFKNEYRVRSGIESTNSLLKRVTGLGRLRVRGRKGGFMSIQLKVAGWNVLRAAKVLCRGPKSAFFRPFVSLIELRQTASKPKAGLLAV